jgi:tRNA/tmRNA/rRNA uracil-C5-methylase (TrmA/RlmC/RlmD family)
MHRNDEITIRPEELVAGGEALARVEGLPVFVRNLYPGDLAVVRLVEVKKGFARAEVVRVIEASPERRALPCPVAEECGGCDWTALRLDRQLAAKRRILAESLRRIGKFDAGALPSIRMHPSPLNYRLRSRLQVDPGSGAAGFFAMRSNRVVPLPPECEVVGPQVIANLAEVQEFARETGEAVQTWEVGTDLYLDPAGPRDGQELAIEAGNFHYALSTKAFFQVNRHLLETMLALVTAHARRCIGRERAIDLYSGVGFFTLPLATLFHEVTAVEGSGESQRYAQRNARPYPNVRPVGGSVEEYVRRMPEADFIFIDPPRAGADRAVMAAIGEKAREQICHLSCDPVTFSRDAARLTASGWRLASLDLLDLFPNTHHIETLASFERAARPQS